MEYKSLNKEFVNFSLRSDPYGWVQFKGTELCMDVHCSCGELTHIDGMFLYFIKCGSCGRIYELNGHIQLIERTSDEFNEIGLSSIKETD